MKLYKLKKSEVQIQFTLEKCEYNIIKSGVCKIESKQLKLLGLFLFLAKTIDEKPKRKFYIYKLDKEEMQYRIKQALLYEKYVGNDRTFNNGNPVTGKSIRFQSRDDRRCYDDLLSKHIKEIKPKKSQRVGFFYYKTQDWYR